jgi:hypothetical protein
MKNYNHERSSIGLLDMKEENIRKAFRWIVTILKERDIPFQVSGGFAAKLYGSERDLLDIDIDVHDKSIDELAPLLEEYAVFGPALYVEEGFKIKLLRLKYEGVQIDLGGSDSAELYDNDKGEYVKCDTDYFSFELLDFFDIKVPVVKKDDLITYKQQLARACDIIDLKFLKAKL